MLPDAGEWDESELRKRLAEVRRELPRLRGLDDLRRAGWYHDYFCDKEGAQLKFDLAKPYEHVCPACGTAYADERRDRAWVTQLRGRRTGLLSTACALAKAGHDVTDLVLAELAWLAENYRLFPVGGFRHSRINTSRLMGTSLDESVCMCNVTLCVAALRDLLPPDLMRRLIAGFLVPAYDLQYSRIGEVEAESAGFPARSEGGRPAHNILVWHGCALAGTALVMRDEERLAYALDAPYGLKFQLAHGPQQDGLWHEGSLGYHCYALRALTLLMGTARELGRELSQIEGPYLRMAGALEGLYFSNGCAPAYSDAWAPARISGVRRLYASIHRLFEDETVARILAAAQGGPFELKQGLWDQPGLRVARARTGRWELAVKYGHLARSHRHPDVGSVIVLADGEELIGDLGTTGYGCDVHRWRRSPMCHNTVVPDNAFDMGEVLGPGLAPGRCELKEDCITIEGTIAGNCTLKRVLRLTEDRIEDTVRVKSERDRAWTWWLHLNAPFEDAAGAPAPERFAGIRFIEDVVDQAGRSEFRSGPLTIRMLNREPDDRVFAVASPGNAAVPRRYGLAWDRHGRVAEFRSEWGLGEMMNDE